MHKAMETSLMQPDFYPSNLTMNESPSSVTLCLALREIIHLTRTRLDDIVRYLLRRPRLDNGWRVAPQDGLYILPSFWSVHPSLLDRFSRRRRQSDDRQSVSPSRHRSLISASSKEEELYLLIPFAKHDASFGGSLRPNSCSITV